LFIGQLLQPRCKVVNIASTEQLVTVANTKADGKD